MNNSIVEKHLDKYLAFKPLYGGNDKAGGYAFFEEDKLSIRGLKVTKHLDFSDYFLESILKIKDVKSIEFRDCIFEKDVLINSDVKSIKIDCCEFQEKLYINKQTTENNFRMKLEEFFIENSECKGNFKLHNCEVNNFFIKDSDFMKKADFFRSKIHSGSSGDTIEFNSINFEELAIFGEVEFHKKVAFKYVTFKGYVHFRGATFKGGIDLDYSNIEKEINFYDVKGLTSESSQDNTTQETYRIIKYQLKKVGNVIDSNKFHAFELKKKQSNVCKCSLDYIVLFVHGVTSEYSQNWLRPIIGIFIVGVLTLLSIKFFCCAPDTEVSFSEVFKYISIINIDKEFKETPIIFVLNKISLGYLYYQFLTSVRKDTKI